MAETLLSPGIAMTESDQSQVIARPMVAGAALVGPTVKGPVNVPTKVSSYSEYVRTFGTTFKTIISGGAEVQQEFLTSLAANSYFQQGGDSLLVVRVAPSGAFGPAQSTIIPASGSESTESIFTLHTLSVGENLNSTNSNAVVSGSLLVSGTADNLRFEINGVNPDRGTFNLDIRRGNDNDAQKTIVERFSDLSLDVYSDRYIERVIGTQELTCENTDGDYHINTNGSYPNNSAYVRVTCNKPVFGYFDNEGNPRAEAKALLPADGTQGAFFGGRGIVGACYETGAIATGSFADYFKDIKTTGYPQSVQQDDYIAAFSLLENSDDYQVNIISAPGLIGGLVSQMISTAEKRGDCIAVVDYSPFGSTVQAATTNVSGVSSYAATYWPWIQIGTSTGRLEWVPASTVIPGVYANTDKSAAPWYAPAGMTRGSLGGVIQTERKLTKKDRDILYNKNINPIATLPPAGLVIYGQKTLQKKASALDRVNVRRLLNNVKKYVRDAAAGLLFEQNSQALQNSFYSQVDPYLASIVSRYGLYGYKIDLSGNTNDAIDRNEFHCRIYIQPTKVIEFVYLDFTVTATGVDFSK